MTELERESKRFHKNLDNGCWHEFDTEPKEEMGEIDRSCIKCGWEYILWGKQIIPPDANPTYTIELIRSELERVGKLNAVLDYIESDYPQGDEYGTTRKEFAKICQTPLLLLQAANSYMGRHEA